MDKQQAQDIVRETFENPFDKGRFVGFVKNLLNGIDESQAFHARGYVPEIFKDHIKTYERIGTYTDPENKKTDILIVYLQKSKAVERARTTQRNFIARYLKDRGEKDAGLIAFVSPDGEDWRFSFVKMEYKFVETPEGKVKVKEDFTPARRYSFLVGTNENSHTAQSRLAPLLLDDESSFSHGQIEDAFNADIYTYFYHRGLDILKSDGHLCFIAPNKFMRAGYGKNTRALLATKATPKIVIDFADLPIFDATTYPSILLLEKRLPENDDMTATATFSISSQLERLEETLEEISFPMPVKALRSEGWNLERQDVLALMEKLRKAGKPLGEYVQGHFYRGVLTGLNEAFVIDATTREGLIAEDPKSEELIKPWLRGRDIRKWKAEWAGLHVIFTRRGVDIERYPAIKRHLEQFRKDLEPKKSEKQKHGRKPGSYQWFEIQDNIAYYEEFEGPKIVYPNITKTNIFAFDTTGILTNQKCFIIPTDDLCLLANLNSKLAMQWFMSTLPQLRGGFFEPSAIFMQQFPVAVASDKQKAPIIEHVKKILANPDSPDVPRLEREIDQLVYALYGLTPEEIEIVEGKK